jgi:hypothetical protein
MKIAAAVLSFLLTTLPFAAAKKVRDEYLGAVEPMDATPVIVKVQCVGADLTKATISMGGFAGTILEQTYAMVHPPTELDDSSLTSLVFHGHGMMSSDNTAVDNHNKNIDDTNGRSNNNDNLAFDEAADAETTDLQPTTDSKNIIIERSKATPAVYTGRWNCGYACPGDASGVTKKAWEAAFVSDLVGTGMKFFAAVKSCSIDMELTPSENENANAALNVKCKGIKIKHPTVAEATYTAHALEASYNKIHGHHEGDDQSMSHASFSVQKSQALVAQLYSNNSTEESSPRLDQWSYFDLYWSQILYVQ